MALFPHRAPRTQHTGQQADPQSVARQRRARRALAATRRDALRDERGVAFPSPVVGLTVVAVAMAGVAFLATDGPEQPAEEVVAVSQPSEPETSESAEATTEAPAPQQVTKPKKVEKKPAVKRSETYVVVFNNTNIAGLAGSVAGRAQGAGWQVVGSDNWVGTIPESTVYYPPRLKEAGRMLARDLGIQRRMPSVEPMQFDRLTVILTGDV